jgi:hypothetical protein
MQAAHLSAQTGPQTKHFLADITCLGKPLHALSMRFSLQPAQRRVESKALA